MFSSAKADIVTDASGRAVTEFNGSLLTKGEPDGSSFPNGGIRHTNAARGYTFWDPTSPAYMLDTENGATLSIPCVLVSWTGEALDKKVPLMRSNGWGRVVNIPSAHGLTASPFKSAYVAAKHGVVGLTKVTALETAEEPITCNAICPGYVLTPLVEAQIPDTMKQYGMDRETVIREVIMQRQPSKTFATVEQLGGCVAFLCSAAADQITGTTLSVDGGWTAL